MNRLPPGSTLFPYTTLFRSAPRSPAAEASVAPSNLNMTLTGVAARATGDAGQRHVQEIGEHTSELQSPVHLVCRLLLEKKKAVNRRSSAPRFSLTCS